MVPDRRLYHQNSPGYIHDPAAPANVVEYAVAIEDVGWNGVFLADGLRSVFASIDPWTALAGAVRLDFEQVAAGLAPKRATWQRSLGSSLLKI